MNSHTIARDNYLTHRPDDDDDYDELDITMIIKHNKKGEEFRA
jgi:hypothetical protein